MVPYFNQPYEPPRDAYTMR